MAPDVRRPARRVPVALFIADDDDSVPFGKSRDVSTSGMFVVTTKKPPIGSVHDIWFIWGEDSFTARARIVRHEKDGVGLTFDKPDETFVTALKEIVGTGEFRAPKLK